MKRHQAIELNVALHAEGLKVKHLSSENYVALIGLKRPLAKYIEEMIEAEKELCIGYGYEADEIAEKSKKDKGFTEKMKAIQSKDFTPKQLNFIPMEEFKKFTDEVDFGPASVLAEYLLKE